jgi:nitrite reductase/ring-hydroxylating ferredoxin subunit
MLRWINVGKVHDFPEGEKVEKTLNRAQILILRQEEKWHAFEALCPHMSRSLQPSRVNGNVLECIWHNMRFNIETGEILYKSGFIGIPHLKTYEVKVENGKVYVKDDGAFGSIRLSRNAGK